MRTTRRWAGLAVVLALMAAACGAEAPEEAEPAEGAPEAPADGEAITFITQVAETEEAGIREVAARFEEQTGIPSRSSSWRPATCSC
jgi:ABC-type glycerol-3-phosphate transport system substrate-binding protein